MAEAAGLVIGLASLAGLFSSCIQAFDLVQMVHTMDCDLRVLHQRLDNQKLRFAIWGQSLGLDGSLPPPTHDPDDETFDAITKASIQQNMKILEEIFENANTLNKRYGLRTAAISSQMIQVHNRTPFGSAWQRVRAKVSKSSQTSARQQYRWICSDRRRFQELILHVEGLVNDLESLTRHFASAAKRRRRIVECEISELSVDDLQSVAAASSEPQDELPQAAHIRLLKISGEQASNDLADDFPASPSPGFRDQDDLFPQHAWSLTSQLDSSSAATEFYSVSEGRFRYQNLADPRGDKEGWSDRFQDAANPTTLRQDLIYAIGIGDLKVVKGIFDKGPVGFIDTLREGPNLITTAVQSLKPTVTRYLLETHPELAASNGSADSPLIAALNYSGGEDCLELLLKSEFVDLTQRDIFGQDALCVAISQNRFEMARRIVQAEPSLVVTQYPYGQSVLHRLLFNHKFFRYLTQSPWMEFIELVLDDQKFDVQAKDSFGRTILDWAIHLGNHEYVELFVEKRPECIDNSKWYEQYRQARLRNDDHRPEDYGSPPEFSIPEYDEDSMIDFFPGLNRGTGRDSNGSPESQQIRQQIRPAKRRKRDGKAKA